VAAGLQPAEVPVAAGLQPAEVPVAAGLQPAEVPVAAGLQPVESHVAAGLQPAESHVAAGLQPAEWAGYKPAPTAEVRESASGDRGLGFLVVNGYTNSRKRLSPNGPPSHRLKFPGLFGCASVLGVV
jgi:hypothetical protein